MPYYRDGELGGRLAHGQTPSGTEISEHDSWKKLPTISNGLAFNDSVYLPWV